MRNGLIAFAMIAFATVGCAGVSQELYDARGTELEKLKQEMAQAQAKDAEAKKACDQRIADLDKSRAAEQAEAQKRVAELKAQAEMRAKQFQALADKLRSMVDSGKLQVEIRNGLMLVKLSDAILFDSGKADLKTDGKTTLKELASALGGIEGRKFQVAGHTDDQPLGKGSRFKDNWSLSTARAVQVVNFMIKDGGLSPERLSAAGWADQMPIAKNDDDNGRKQNRRIEFVLLPNIDELPSIQAAK
jgi:chemotaxis protein MotB